MKNIFKVDGRVNIKALIISVVVTFAAGFLGALAGKDYFNDYLNLYKPVFAPPSFVFPVVWTILYILMAIAVYRVYLKIYSGLKEARAIKLYTIQLILNFLWPVIFFNFRLYGISFFELLFLLIFILITTFEFLKIDKLSAFLMIPYIVWVSFAGVLNYAIWMMN